MSAIEAFEVLKTKEFTVVIDCFQNKNNEKRGHYGQALIDQQPINWLTPKNTPSQISPLIKKKRKPTTPSRLSHSIKRASFIIN